MKGKRWVKAPADNRKGFIWIPVNEKDFVDMMFWNELKEKESAAATTDSDKTSQR